MSFSKSAIIGKYRLDFVAALDVGIICNAVRSSQRFRAMVPIVFNLADLTQPLTSLPVRGLRYITDVQPSRVCA